MGKIVDALDKFSGVVGAFVIFYGAGKFIYDNYTKVPPKFLIIAGIIALLSVLVFIRKIKNAITALRMRRIEAEAKAIINRPQDKKFSTKLILTNKQIDEWLELSEYKAKKWSDDVEISEAYQGYSFDFDLVLGARHILGTFFYSRERGEIMSFIFGKTEPGIGEMQDLNYVIPKTPLPFYKNQPKWRSGVLAVYKFIEDKWEHRLHFFVCTVGYPGEGLVMIDYSYGVGNRGFGKNGSFTFDGKYIFNDQIKIKVN